MKNKKIPFHPIANTYPMMRPKEFNNLVGSMEEKGFDKNFPILLFEQKILDGRNRYLAALEANVEPIFLKFVGTFEEAVCESRRLNSYRRNLSKCQKAMVAAKEIMLTRTLESKNLSVKKASMIYDVSEGYIKLAMKINEQDTELAQNVFEGQMTLKEAEYRVCQIQMLREAVSDDLENNPMYEQSAIASEISEDDSCLLPFELSEQIRIQVETLEEINSRP